MSEEATGGEATGGESTAPAGGEGASSTGGESSDWRAGLSEDVKMYVEQKGFKDPASVLDSYRNLEKLHGVPKERLLKLPEKADAPEWADVYSRLGKPASKDDYAVESDNEKFSSWAKDTFYKLNLTKTQAEGLLKEMADFEAINKVESKESYDLKVAAEENALKKEWGAAYEQNMTNAKLARQAFDMSAEAIDALESAMGFDGVMKFLNSLGEKMGEANFHSGTSGAGFSGSTLTPQRAQAEIRALRADKDFVVKYSRGDREAQDRMAKLHQMAYPDLS